MDKKFSIRQFPSPEHPYIAFPQKNLAVLNISRFTTGEIGPQSRLNTWYDSAKYYNIHQRGHLIDKKNLSMVKWVKYGPLTLCLR